MDYFGYMGNVCKVDLTTGTISIEPLVERDLDRFMGCSGYAAKILWDVLGAKIDPLSDKNKIILATGPLTGSLCPSGGSYELCFKSPLTGVWCQARSGGAFGPRLKKAGFDHLVIEGRSDRPVYLWIHNGKVEIRGAGHLWGKGVDHTTDVILKEIGAKKVQVIKAVRTFRPDLGLKEAKELVDSAPVKVLEGAPKEQAEAAAQALKAEDAVAEIV